MAIPATDFFLAVLAPIGFQNIWQRDLTGSLARHEESMYFIAPNDSGSMIHVHGAGISVVVKRPYLRWATGWPERLEVEE
jgi:hypothetical protein